MSAPRAADEATAVGGRYEIHAEIGAGGMATVHLGRLLGARGFSRTVAIKVLHATYAKNRDFVERFLDEARLVGRIHHPNVMPTLDVIAQGEDLRIVMDYVSGESLDQLQAVARATGSGERIPVRIACAIVAGALHGLHAAHEAKNEFGEPLGIVHLDVSPQNIMVGTDGVTRVLDFGVARARASTEKASTTTSGKSAYLAPEQIRGAEVSPRTDVFAASIVLWELCTGESLFASDNHAATMQRVLAGEIPRASAKAHDIPARLDEILQKGLQRDASQRFATARDMALALEQAVPPALASEVGRWVEQVAEATLVTRAAQVREMESLSGRPGQLPGLVDTRELYGEAAAVNLPSEDLVDDLSSSTLLRPPAGAGRDAVPQRSADGTVRWRARRAAPDAAIAAGPAAPRPDGRKGVGPTLVSAQPQRRRAGVLLAGLTAAVVTLAIAAVVARALLLPRYVMSVAIGRAAAHGVTLTIADAALSRDGVQLTGLTARLVGVPQASATIAAADVRSVWSPPTKVILGKTELTVDGDASAVLSSLAAWSSAHRGGKSTEDEPAGGVIEAPAVHLVWTHPGADVMRLEARGLQGSIGSPASASLGDDAHALTSALTVETKLGGFGPWGLDVDATLKGTRARLAFDPAVPDGPNALVVLDALGDMSLDVAIPRVPAGSLGVPRTALGPEIPFPQQIELAVHYGRLTHDQATATLKGAFYGLRLAELGGMVDAHLTVEAAGPTGSPLPLRSGIFTLGALRAGVSGTVTPVASPPSVRANLAWKAEPILCSSLVALPTPGAAARDLTRKAVDGDLGDLGQLARDFGALGEAVGAVKVTGAFAASGTLVIDSADLAHTRFTSAAKNACGLVLFGGKDATGPGGGPAPSR